MSKRIVNEPKTIHLCFVWIYRVLFYTGILSYRLKDEKLSLTIFTRVYSNIMRLVLVLGFVGGFAIKLNDEESVSAMLDHLPPILKFVMTFEGVTSTFTYILVSLLLDWQKRAQIKLAEQFQYLDERFKMEFPQISWNYHKSMRKYTTLTLLVMCCYLIVSMSYLINITNCFCDIVNTFVIAICYALLTLAPGTAAFLQVCSVDILRLRYRLIIRLLAQTKLQDNEIKHKLFIIQRLSVFCRRYTELIAEINNVYGYVIAASVFYDFGILTNMVYLICQKVFEGKAPIQDYIFILLFMAPRMYKVIIMPMYGNQLEKEKRRCIHDLSVYIDDFKHSKEAQDLFRSFIHWKMLGNYEATVGKSIPYNLNILFMVLNGITNYVLILIQLELQQNTITDRVRHNFQSRRTAELVEYAG